MKKFWVCLLFVIITLVIYLVFHFDILNSNYQNLDYDENDVMAIIYVGSNMDSYDYSLVNKYFDEEEIPEVKLSGEEKYLIIPRYNMDINIYGLEMNDNGLFVRKFIDTIKGNFYLICNESDLYSNVLISFDYKNKEYEYSPYISLKDGNLVTQDFILYIHG